MPSIVQTALPLAFVAFAIYHGIKAYSTYRKLAHFKGPPLAGWTSLWLAKQAISANMPTAQKEALRIYSLLTGLVFRRTSPVPTNPRVDLQARPLALVRTCWSLMTRSS